MAIHRALLIPDILNLIFQEIKHDKSTLASAALTCRSLSPMALDFLWKTLDTSTPMKRLLPNLWNADGTYKTVIDPSLWKHFDAYAKRVEVLGVDELDARERYRWQLYCQVCSLRPGVIPFPNLRKLRLYQDFEQADRDRSLLLFPSSLCELRIDFGSITFNRSLRVAEGYMQSAALQVPMLKNLSLHGDPPATAYMCISQFEHLCILDLRHAQTIDAQAYQHLITSASTMTQLVELHLPNQGMNGITGNCIPMCKGFNRLQVLGIHSSPNNITQFLDTLDTPSLRVVICKGGNIQSKFSEWLECVRRICSNHGDSLRSVELRSRALNVWDSGFGGRQQMFKEIIMFLRALHRLEEVVLEFFMVDLPIEDLHAMAAAWPNLRRLKIKSKIVHRSRTTDSPSTYNCLITLAQLCPKLVHLELFIQDDKLPNITEWPRLSHRLRELKLDVPRLIKDQLEPFIDLIFPEKHYI